MPASHQFNRRVAALGAALALVALPISGTLTTPPAVAQPGPTAAADAGSTDDEATGGADGTDGADEAGSDSIKAADSTAADSTTADSDTGADSADEDEAGKGTGGGSDGGDDGPDDRCAGQDEDESTPDPDKPCETDEKLKAKWNSGSKTLTVDRSTLPDSWVDVPFEGPKQEMVRIPAQSAQHSAGDDSTASVGSDSDTDDSGQSVSEATNQADAPTEFEFNSDGEITPAGEDEAMEFEHFAPDGPHPAWTFTSNGRKIMAEGEKYPDSDDDGSDADTSGGSDSDSEDSKNADSSRTAAKDGTDTAGSDASADKDSDGTGADSDTGSDSDTASSDSKSSAGSDTSTDSDTSADSDSKDRGNASTDEDSDGTTSKADTDSTSDASSSSDSDSSGSDSASGQDEEKDSDSDKDGSGSPLGTADADGTTPDPSNGNGSEDDTRETIPGTAGDDWLPSDEDDSRHPDYSDPVPQNPEAPTPKDDTDLITGGDQPSPRANQNPSTSFGESIISTIVSSWPVFVLAASGMAAVGFIIYLMGRRGKQD